MTYVAERSTHDDGLVAVLLVVVEDLLDGLDTRVLVANVCRSGLVLLVPVKDLMPSLGVSALIHELDWRKGGLHGRRRER